MDTLCENMEEKEKVSKELLRMMTGGKASNMLKQNLAKQEQVIDKLLDTQKSTKQLIKELMTVEEEVAQKLFDREEELKVNLQKLQKIEDQLLQANEEDTRLKISTDELKKELEALREEIKQQEKNEDDEANMSKAAKYLVQLYYLICHIDWDYSCEPSIIKGIHYGPDIAQPINLDTRLHSRCFINDYLWNLVNTSW